MIIEKEKHMCINCRYYCKGAHYDCHENIDELVKDKDRPNFCEFFAADEDAIRKHSEESKGKASAAEDAFNKFFNI